MIYTCTLNPAIDLFVTTDELRPDEVNRTSEEDYQANGKGINVSIILKKLGIDSTALGFTAGFTGEYIKDELRAKGIKTDFIDINGITRVNTFVHTKDKEFKIVNRGPNVSAKEVGAILEKINALPEHATLFVSGSTPRGVDDAIYLEIAKIAEAKQLRLILDISSKVLLDCLAYRPYLIKPNKEELTHFFGKKSITNEEVLELGNKLLAKGAERVLISLGEEGAIYLDESHNINVSSPKGKVINTACAGDTMLAMFVQKYEAGFSIEQALTYASAAGASTAFSEGLSNLKDVEELRKQILSNKGGKKDGKD